LLERLGGQRCFGFSRASRLERLLEASMLLEEPRLRLDRALELRVHLLDAARQAGEILLLDLLFDRPHRLLELGKARPGARELHIAFFELGLRLLEVTRRVVALENELAEAQKLELIEPCLHACELLRRGLG